MEWVVLVAKRGFNFSYEHMNSGNRCGITAGGSKDVKEDTKTGNG